MNEKLIVGMAQGDINGVGSEILVKILADNQMCEVCTPIVIGSPKVMGYYKKSIETEEEPVSLVMNLIQKPEDASDKRTNIINCFSDEVRVDPGIETKVSDECAMLALKQGLDFVDNNRIDVLVSAPIGDYAYDLERATSLIHYLALRYESDYLLPLFVGEKMKLAFISSGKSVKDSLSQLTIPNVIKRLKMIKRALERDFGIDKPKIAVLALNASTGDGVFGDEEERIIKPAIEQAREENIFAVGPYAADRFFSERVYEKFDVVLALHNDQGMIPFKSVEGNSGVISVAGLPCVFTTPVHGMAYDIVDKGYVETQGMSNAIYLAIDIFKARAKYAELTRNPLKRYDVGGDKRESDLNVEQIAGVSDSH